MRVCGVGEFRVRCWGRGRVLGLSGWLRAGTRGWCGRESRCRRCWGCTRRWGRCRWGVELCEAGGDGVFGVAGLVQEVIGEVEEDGDCESEPDGVAQ